MDKLREVCVAFNEKYPEVFDINVNGADTEFYKSLQEYLSEYEP